MADTNYRIRFMANNLAALALNNFSFSSQVVGFEAENALDNFRSSTWKMAGYFEIVAGTNDKIYINDGSNKTITLSSGGYTTASQLATHIQTQLNLSSSAWTVSYETVLGTYKFTLTHSGSATLRLSVSAQSTWDTLGFTSSTDMTGTTFEANEQRNHSFEFMNFDFGWQTPITFTGMVGDIASSFGLSSSALVTLEGNNIDVFTSPPFTKTLTITDKGIFTFNITDTDAAYRFWRLRIQDKYNPVGPGIEIGNIYLGDFQTLTGRNFTSGFEDKLIDPSTSSQSEAGVIFFDKRTKYTTLSGVALKFLELEDQVIIKDLFKSVGLTEPFYVSLDPLGTLTDDITDYTKFVVFTQEPNFVNVGAARFHATLNFRELV